MIELALTIGGISMSATLKKLKKISNKNLEIVRKCKFRLYDGAKVKLKNDVQTSIDGVKMGRLEDLLYKEKIEVDNTNLKSDITSITLANPLEAVTALNTITGKNAPRYTFIIPMNKKDIHFEFDMLKDTTLGELLRTTYLPLVYKKVSDDWKKLNEKDKTESTNVLYIPNVMHYLDLDGKIKSRPFYINILIVAVPELKYLTNGEPETRSDDEFYTGRIVADILDSAIKVGATHLVFNPFGINGLKNDLGITANCWKVISTTKRVLENLESIILTADDSDTLFVTLNSIFNK